MFAASAFDLQDGKIKVSEFRVQSLGVRAWGHQRRFDFFEELLDLQPEALPPISYRALTITRKPINPTPAIPKILYP